jgi:hypothetical protein
MGVYLSDKDEETARGLLKSEVGRRFVLRHPWLTGIPTLGLAPAIAKDQAYSKVMRKMLRGSPSLQKRHGNWLSEARNKRREEYEANTKRLKATETSRTAANLALAALTAQQAHYAEGKK